MRLMLFLNRTWNLAVRHDVVAYLGSGKGRPWRARRARAYNGGLGAEPPAGSRGRAPGRWFKGAKPPWSWNAFCFWTFNGSRKFAHFFLKFGSAENHSVISDAISHGDFNFILYRYEKRPSDIVEFCNSCWKTAKKRTVSYKVALKNFHGRAKGGASHRGPPPKYATDTMFSG